jgi:hypothetical protein
MLRATLNSIETRKAIEVSGEWIEQAREISGLIDRFVFTANVEQSIALPNIHVVFEDFVLRRRQQGGATGDLTSVWVAAGTVARIDRPVTWQMPSMAKGFATNERLKSWGLWEVGSEHKRDAWRHFATYVNSRIV